MEEVKGEKSVVERDGEVGYERLAIKGFDWLDKELNKPTNRILGSTGFKNFKLEDQKKKWKKNKCKCFQGLGQKIHHRIESNPQIRESNTAQIKQRFFERDLERIELKNSYEKIKKISKVSQIYVREKNYRIGAINDYFDQEIEWIRKRTS